MVENVIYLVNLKGSKVGMPTLRTIANKANDNFKKMGLNARVRIYTAEQFDRFDMDKTDEFALIGQRKDIVDEITSQRISFFNEIIKGDKSTIAKDVFGKKNIGLKQVKIEIVMEGMLWVLS